MNKKGLFFIWLAAAASFGLIAWTGILGLVCPIILIIIFLVLAALNLASQ